jgi:alcohol dehydrogenase class IV
MGVTNDMTPDLAVHCMTDACHFANPKIPTVGEYETMFEDAISG